MQEKRMRDDAISRQAAIDALDCINGTEEVLRSLPSAQPEQAVKDCRNCKYGKYNDHWKTHFCYNPNECTKWNLWEPSAQTEIVKCKKCRYVYYDKDFDNYWCNRMSGSFKVEADDFCSRAERRTDECID